jgi:hypothetical protein
MTLFPRRHGGSQSLEFATRCKAHRLLDRARAGDDVSARDIQWALRQTGDDNGRQRMAPSERRGVWGGAA